MYPFARASARFTRHAASQFVYAGSQLHSLVCSRRITKLSHPPGTGLRGRLGTRRRPVEEGGQAGSRGSCPSGPLIYLSTLPGQPKYKSDLPSFLIVDRGDVVPPLVCSVRYQGRLAGRRLRPGGREQQRAVAVSNPMCI
jgi:hypothetical protein